MLDSILRRIAALSLDLSGMTVLTEAGTGPYACTAVMAAMAGAANVFAVARGSAKYGEASVAVEQTRQLACRAGVLERVNVVDGFDGAMLADCDILTNSGHVRPITREIIAKLRPSAVIALMFEAWEFRSSDLDRDACRDKGIRIAAVNERHCDVGVFPFLGPLCVKLLRQAGMDVPRKRIAVLCDNPFAPFIEAGLKDAGSSVAVFASAEALPAERWDAVVVALHPDGPVTGDAFERLAKAAPGALIAQFWGDLDRPALRALGFRICPGAAPSPGHMGLLLSALGHEPIVRLQGGGLRAAELVFRGEKVAADGVASVL